VLQQPREEKKLHAEDDDDMRGTWIPDDPTNKPPTINDLLLDFFYMREIHRVNFSDFCY